MLPSLSKRHIIAFASCIALLSACTPLSDKEQSIHRAGVSMRTISTLPADVPPSTLYQSKNGEHVAFIETEEKRERMVVDGVAGKWYARIFTGGSYPTLIKEFGKDLPLLRNDGTVAYEACSDDRCANNFVVIGSTEYVPKGIKGEALFAYGSEGANKIATWFLPQFSGFSARGKLFINNNRIGSEYAGTGPAVFSADESTMAYVAVKGPEGDEQSYVVKNAEVYGPYTGTVWHLQISPSGNFVGYIAHTGVRDTTTLFMNGKEILSGVSNFAFGPHDELAVTQSPSLTNSGKIIVGDALLAHTKTFPLPSERGVDIQELIVNNGHVAYKVHSPIFTSSDDQSVFLDGKQIVDAHGFVPELVLNDNGTVAFLLNDVANGSSYYVQKTFSDAKAMMEDISPSNLVINAKGDIAALYLPANPSFYHLLLNGKPYPGAENVETAGFMPDGRVYYVSTESGKMTLVLDGQKGQFFEGILGKPVFHPDGKHVSYIARKGRDLMIVEENL